jgi:SAM-dependent methyltransferase
MRDDVRALTTAYSKTLDERGVTPEGVLWPNAADLANRYQILLGIRGPEPLRPDRAMRVLDLGCGPGFLLDYLDANKLLARVEYRGVDIVDAMIGHARSRWPDQVFELRDIRERPFAENAFDVCIACGVFTSRFGLGYRSMEVFVKETLKSAWPSVTKGLAFNVMSKHVDWERDDLFHWPLDNVMAFCKAELSRHVRFRLDYGLWEASVFVLRDAAVGSAFVPAVWTSGAR